ncbi:MAG: tetratricopeptide repeat protein, partial [Promethearchaeota archaeon]
MPESGFKDLRYAEKLRHEGKLQEALEVINNIEKKGTLTPGDQLTLLISKGKILTINQRYEETTKLGKLAYRLSKTLGRPHDTVYSLLFKASSLFLGKPEKALKNLFEAEILLNSLSDVSPSYFNKQKTNILFKKSWAYLTKGDLNKALEIALECLELQEKYGYKSDTAYTLQVLCSINIYRGDYNLALDYGSRSLILLEDIDDQTAVATTQALLGNISYSKGELNQAIEYIKKSLSSKRISSIRKLDNLLLLGAIYSDRGEVDKALKYYKQGITLSEKGNIYNSFINFQIAIGGIHLQKGEYDLALEFLEPSLSLAEEINDAIGISMSLTHLLRIHLVRDDDDEIQKYLERFKKYEAQIESKTISNSYHLLKAAALIKKGGSHNRVESATLLKRIITDETFPTIKAYALIYLCEFYLEELKLFEDAEVLKDLNPLVAQLYNFSEE